MSSSGFRPSERGETDVRAHYNTARARPAKGDYMLAVRNAHNFAKARLISTAQPRRVLDMCCGSGGDVHKFERAGCSAYFGVDVAEDAVARAEERATQLPRMRATFVSLDCFSHDMIQLASSLPPFDLVNCQFGLHYALRSESTCRDALRAIATALREGGTCVGILADGDCMDERRRRLGTRFGDRYFKVAFHSRERADFGDAYAFSFTGAVDGCVEYATRRSVLEPLVREAGLQIVQWEGLKNFIEAEIQNHRSTWHRMCGADSYAAADVTRLYSVFRMSRAPASDSDHRMSATLSHSESLSHIVRDKF